MPDGPDQGARTPAELLAGLRRRGFDVRAEGGGLRVSPRARLTPEETEQVKAHRDALLDLLAVERMPAFGYEPVRRYGYDLTDAEAVEAVNAWNGMLEALARADPRRCQHPLVGRVAVIDAGGVRRVMERCEWCGANARGIDVWLHGVKAEGLPLAEDRSQKATRAGADQGELWG